VNEDNVLSEVRFHVCCHPDGKVFACGGLSQALLCGMALFDGCAVYMQIRIITIKLELSGAAGCLNIADVKMIDSR
jgi:hypothetical protein